MALIGHKGVGKTTLGKIWAKELGYIFFDTDDILLKWFSANLAKNYSSPAMAYRDLGEKIFRDCEHKAFNFFMNKQVLSLPDGSKVMLATGGGLPLSQENRLLLEKFKKTFYLFIPPLSLLEHYKKNIRPSFLNVNDAAEFLKWYYERDQVYRSIASECIDSYVTHYPYHEEERNRPLQMHS